MGIINNYKEVVNTRDRREVLLAMTSGQLLVQLSSMPVTLALPSVARHFDVGLEDAAWIVIVNLMVLGSTVFLGARLGDRFGHPRVFFIGTIMVTVGAGLVATAQSMEQAIIWRGLQGLGAGLIHGNGNAMLAYAFPPGERGRAYAFPITGSRIGTLIGLVCFGLFLEYISWRLVFLVVVPIGLLAIWGSMPALRQQQDTGTQKKVSIDYWGAVLLVATASVFFLATVHAHGGDDSFTSADGLSYHLPMTVLFLAMLGLFILVERRVASPFLDFRHFREKYFTLAITSNTMFHFSMLAVFTLVPLMIEEGKGLSPIFVTLVILPHQSFGVFMPILAGNFHDKYNFRYMRPACMASIALGFVLLGLFAQPLPVWFMPLLLLPISLGTNVFNTINNATVMSTLPVEHRGFASGMLETTRDLGHALGATASSVILALVLPIAIASMAASEAQLHYMKGFQTAALAVVAIMLTGAFIASFHRPYQALQQSPAAAGD